MMMSKTNGVETTSVNQLNSFSPISTLDRQYAAPLGQRLIIGVQANAACCLEGGMESILRLSREANDNLSTQQSLPLDANGNGATATNFEASKDDDFDAFAFLNEESSGGAPAPATAAGNGHTKRGIGGFFRKVAQSTTATLERQMQGLAVKIDNGRNPDKLTVGMYDPVSAELLGLTEWVPLPAERQDVRFEIPLVVPGNRRQQKVLIKLWIQSGAALLQNKIAKCYLLGSTTLDCMQLNNGTAFSLALTSNLVAGAQLQFCVAPDPKFSQVFHRGWSLTDPDMSGYSSNLFNLPLDQSFVFQGKQPEHWLVATERATESSVVLPLAAAVMELAAKASQKSLLHAQGVAKQLRVNRHDHKDPTKATCNLGIVAVSSKTTPPSNASISVSWRRPDSIFELELLANERIAIADQNVAAAFANVNFKFYPKVCTEGILPGIMAALGGKLPPSGFLLGALCFSVTVQSHEGQIEVWDSIVGLESFIDGPANTIQIPLVKNAEQVGNLLLQIQVAMPEEKGAVKLTSPNDGLVSLVGLESLAEGVKPIMDDGEKPGEALGIRGQQLATMGFFFTTQYMEQHLALRQTAVESFQERARAYKQALAQPENVAPCETKSPKPFRPSSSRMESLLSAIPFNVHIASLNISVIDTMQNAAPAGEYPGASFHNITHGAPSDHARGFGNVLNGVSNANASGGLRRLEAKRWELSQMLKQAQSNLISGVGNYLAVARKTGQVNHVPSRHAEIQGLRWKTFECVHSLHHVTWMCSVRRANVFSQSLGLAVSSYLASLSDVSKCAAGWPEVWRRHGYMVCFEGLLSAAGKELGMIEDASVAIAMLRMVRIVLMPDNGIPSKAIYVPSSPYLKWVNLFASGEGYGRHYLLQIGVDANYYNERVPEPLRNGTAVKLYPLLYQVGVDIRQWGAHAGSNLRKNGKPEVTGGLMEDEDDDVGVVDDDVLVALNYEALRKMNAYAHAISPQQVLLDKVQQAMESAFSPQYGLPPPDGELPVHQSLSLLHSHIMSSAGKMNHSILDEAATLAQQLGGGGLVFCKSGKDRTAMHLTYKQAQFGARYRDQHNLEAILRDATLMRTYGSRLPICEKNVGQAKFAFNALQVKFMPDALKPPMNTLAGFLKGGRLFSGEGGIES